MKTSNQCKQTEIQIINLIIEISSLLLSVIKFICTVDFLLTGAEKKPAKVGLAI